MATLSIHSLVHVAVISILIYQNAGLGNDSTSPPNESDESVTAGDQLDEYYDPEEMDPPSETTERETQQCVNTNSVCHTLMEYRDGQVVDEGANCHCTGCSDKWNQLDRRSLTWHHYERNDWLVQYRFCANIIPERECVGDEIAAVMETDVDSWTISMRKAKCRCPNGEYYYSGWHKKNGKWRYEYVCKSPICDVEQPCTKIYVDIEEEVKLGYKFNCACPDDFSCNTEYDITNLESWEEDDVGDYVTNKCKRHKRKKEPAK